MSRSRKNSPFSPVTTATTEKMDKRIAHRQNRRKNTVLLQVSEDETQLVDLKTTSDV